MEAQEENKTEERTKLYAIRKDISTVRQFNYPGGKGNVKVVEVALVDLTRKGETQKHFCIQKGYQPKSGGPVIFDRGLTFPVDVLPLLISNLIELEKMKTNKTNGEAARFPEETL